VSGLICNEVAEIEITSTRRGSVDGNALRDFLEWLDFVVKELACELADIGRDDGLDFRRTGES